ncbi:unnamed protein product [Caenorhabditis bovis]|uniref:Uncharacterized protein n=1 Tax=Caenorhabditis bovis TaxID=2654633 RepID=A0A8S1EL62_9PELO|nr:unnamed protein product [Caenorhabditis bovis]
MLVNISIVVLIILLILLAILISLDSPIIIILLNFVLTMATAYPTTIAILNFLLCFHQIFSIRFRWLGPFIFLITLPFVYYQSLAIYRRTIHLIKLDQGDAVRPFIDELALKSILAILTIAGYLRLVYRKTGRNVDVAVFKQAFPIACFQLISTIAIIFTHMQMLKNNSEAKKVFVVKYGLCQLLYSEFWSTRIRWKGPLIFLSSVPFVFYISSSSLTYAVYLTERNEESNNSLIFFIIDLSLKTIFGILTFIGYVVIFLKVGGHRRRIGRSVDFSVIQQAFPIACFQLVTTISIIVMHLKISGESYWELTKVCIAKFVFTQLLCIVVPFSIILGNRNRREKFGDFYICSRNTPINPEI